MVNSIADKSNSFIEDREIKAIEGRKDDKSLFQKVFGAVNKVFSSTCGIESVIALISRTFKVIKSKGIALSSKVVKGLKTLGQAGTVMDLAGFFKFASYFGAGSYKKKEGEKEGKKALEIAGNSSYLVATTACWASFVKEVEISSLAKISQTIGRVPFLGRVVSVGLGTVGLATATLGKLAFVAKDIFYGERNLKSYFSIFDGVLNVAFKSLLLLQVTNPAVYVFGAIAAGTSIVKVAIK